LIQQLEKKVINTIHDFSVLPLPIEAPMKGAFFVKEFYGRNNQDSDGCTYLTPFEQLTQTSQGKDRGKNYLIGYIYVV